VLTGHAFLSLREAYRERDYYRDLAFLVARSPFTPSVRDTAFQYFEQMADYLESGPFDTDPGPDLVPPTDPTTFNGSVWELARETFFVDPDQPPPPDSPQYQQALEFYRERAVGPGFQWSWRMVPADRTRYRSALRESDDAFRRGSVFLGFVVANHLVSAVDAFITGRLETLRSGLAFDSGWDASGVTARRWDPVVYWKLRVAF
jgi:hypothetical protein